MNSPVMEKVVQKLAAMANSADTNLKEELAKKEKSRLDAENKLINSLDSLTKQIENGQKETKKDAAVIKTIGKYFSDKKNNLTTIFKSFTTKEGLLTAAMAKAGGGLRGALVGTLYEKVKAAREAKEEKISYIHSMTHGTEEGRKMVKEKGVDAAREHFSEKFDTKKDNEKKVEKLNEVLHEIDLKYKEFQAASKGEKVEMTAEDKARKDSIRQMIADLGGKEYTPSTMEPQPGDKKSTGGVVDEELRKINSEQLDVLRKIEESVRVTPEEAHEASLKKTAGMQNQLAVIQKKDSPVAQKEKSWMQSALDMAGDIDIRKKRPGGMRVPPIDISDAIVKEPGKIPTDAPSGAGRAGKLAKLARFGKMIPGIGLALAAGSAAMDAFSGASDANEILGIEGREATTGEKIQAGASRALSGLSFGLVDEKTIAGGLSRMSNGLSDLLTNMSETAKEEKPVSNTNVVNNSSTNVTSSVVNTARPSVRNTDPSMIDFSNRNMVF